MFHNMIIMDVFFASVEQSFNPAYHNKPLIVCGDTERRSVVTSASYEARPFGIKAGMPIQEARRLCPTGLFIEGDPKKYLNISLKLVEIYRRFTPIVEISSIDEAFLDITGTGRLFGSPEDIAKAIKMAIRDKFRLTCSIGIAPNKLLAKMAAEFKKPDGLTIIAPEQVPSIIWGLPIKDLYGVGPATEKALFSMGVTTIGALAKISEDILKRRFGIVGVGLHLLANGADYSKVVPEPEPAKSMGHEFTLPEDTSDKEELYRTLLKLASQVGRRLRRDHYRGRTISLKLRYPDFTTLIKSETISEFTDIDSVIYRSARDLLEKHWLTWRKVRLLGISVSNLRSTSHRSNQLELFRDRLKERKLLETMDRIRDKYGEDSVSWASRVKP